MEIIVTITNMRYFLLLVPLAFVASTLAQPPGYFPPPSSVNYHSDTLTIYPPDSLPGDPAVLLGYNVYVDSLFYDNVQVASQNDTADYVFDITTLMPGNREFCAKAVYNSWISEPACDTGKITYGYELPFFEDWSSGDFETNQWTVSSDHWTINTANGNPSPEARFSGTPGLQDYSEVLESFAFRGDSLIIGSIFVEYDISLVSINSTGYESLAVQIYDWTTGNWHTTQIFNNQNGSFEWRNKWFRLLIGKVFKIRFVVSGVISSDIGCWSIDNIHVYRDCIGAMNLYIEENYDYNKLTWEPPQGCWGSDWIHWDDGENYDAIGTGDVVEFDVAARWTPSQLVNYDGYIISKVSFFPNETESDYTIRIWNDTNASVLLYEQTVQDPIMYEWNEISLTDTVLVDRSKELWIGYHINTQTGYPAGCDDGPAINGFGNMMFYQGEWSTLLEINQDLDYNWNIQAFFLQPEDHDFSYNIYRESNSGGFEFYDNCDHWQYYDSGIVLSDFYCYQVTMLWTKGGDTCESDPTNTACETLLLRLNDNILPSEIKIFPNPAGESINIESSDKIFSTRIYNLMGEKIREINLDDSYYQIDVTSLSNGIYFFEIETQSRTVTRKIIINH
jgi:hypothetical protein